LRNKKVLPKNKGLANNCRGFVNRWKFNQKIKKFYKFSKKIKKFCEKVKVLPISKEVLSRDKDLTMKYRGFFKREKF